MSHKMHQLSPHPTRVIACDAHGTHGMLPCAWPGCIHGIQEDQFEQTSLIESRPGQVFTRRSWLSPLGGDYYTWESNEMENWFFLRHTFWNEARRHGLVSKERFSPAVYHYTSLDGFIGIVRSGSVWLSDYCYLNDRQELNHGAAIARDVIDQILGEENDPASAEVLSSWKAQLAHFPNRVCIASFSEDSDSLAQWRAYGPIALGLDVKALGLHVNQAALQRVEYKEDVQRRLIAIYVHHARAAAARDAEVGKFKNISAAYLKPEQLLEIIAFFKDSAFFSEREVRLAFVDNPVLYEELGFKRLPKAFRATRGRLIPYVASTDILKSDARSFPLKFTEVVLGPDADNLLAQGLREFLDEEGLQEVSIRHSVIPFRQ